MINVKDQEELFTLVADYLEKDISCFAIGGTAMMFAGYKTTTKDIDLVFETEEDMSAFIRAIEQLGYVEKSLQGIYDTKRLNSEGKPLMFTRGDERFDLFVKTVFGYELDFHLDSVVVREDFIGKSELIINVLSKEELILLKSITNREKDFEDIETILSLEKSIDWNYIVDRAIGQRKNNSWLLIDLEETLQRLRKIVFLKEELFTRIYSAEEKQ